ncbi:unnamed protein product [Phyllotreta striolata]|uniref:cellulase n=1 Tax=Phyllotreta striolata TaxID=444603 RepID=A0A9N9TTW7_PHYSR|nr:unnamed protein product [Phyllotreta striolata]
MNTVLLLVSLLICASPLILGQIIPTRGGMSGNGTASLYWDCCTPPCADKNNVGYRLSTVQTCQKDGVTKNDRDDNIRAGCQPGVDAFQCNIMQPYVVADNVAFGWASAKLPDDFPQCCMCLVLSFKGKLAGKRLLIQNVNTEGYNDEASFKLLVPGGGVGDSGPGCMTQWNTTMDVWGNRTTGVENVEQCKLLPEALQPGCRFKFEFLEGIDNADVEYQEVYCPMNIVDKSNCDYMYE